MHGVGVPLVGNSPIAAPIGGLHGSSIAAVRTRICDTVGSSIFTNWSTLGCSFIGSPGSGQSGFVENVSLSDAQVSNTTGDGLLSDTGATNPVNIRQMNASEFSEVPSTAPALAGVATTTSFWACAAHPATAQMTARLIALTLAIV